MGGNTLKKHAQKAINIEGVLMKIDEIRQIHMGNLLNLSVELYDLNGFQTYRFSPILNANANPQIIDQNHNELIYSYSIIAKQTNDLKD